MFKIKSQLNEVCGILMKPLLLLSGDLSWLYITRPVLTHRVTPNCPEKVMPCLVATMNMKWITWITDFIYQWIDAPVVMSDLGTGKLID